MVGEGGREQAVKEGWQRIAYACRYGKGIGLSEAADLDHYSLGRLLEALSTIVEQENKS